MGEQLGESTPLPGKPVEVSLMSLMGSPSPEEQAEAYRKGMDETLSADPVDQS